MKYANSYYVSPGIKITLNSLTNFCFYIVVLLLPFKRFTSLGWIGLPEEITLLKLMIALTFFLWFLKTILSKEPLSSPFKRFLYIAVILDIGASLLSLYKATSLSSVIPYLIGTGGAIILFLLVVSIVKNKKIFLYVVIFFILGAAIDALGGVYELISQKPIYDLNKTIATESAREKDALVGEAGGIRIQSFVGDADYNAHLCNISIGIVLGILFGRRFNRPLVGRFLLGLLFILLLTNTIASSSRGGWLSLFVIITAFLLFVQLRYKALLILGFFILIGASFFGLGLFSNTPILERFSGKSGSHSISLREADMRLSLTTFRDNPVLGVGIGNFKVVRHRWAINVPGYIENDVIPASSCGYFSVLVEKGLLGIAAYFAIVFSFIAILMRIMRFSRNREERTMALGLLSSFLGHLTYLITLQVQYSELMWMVIGLGVALSNISEGPTMSNRNTQTTRMTVVPFPGNNYKRPLAVK